jgi:hypothetical protein
VVAIGINQISRDILEKPCMASYDPVGRVLLGVQDMGTTRSDQVDI